jgi:hypothetical protein
VPHRSGDDSGDEEEMRGDAHCAGGYVNGFQWGFEQTKGKEIGGKIVKESSGECEEFVVKESGIS